MPTDSIPICRLDIYGEPKVNGRFDIENKGELKRKGNWGGTVSGTLMVRQWAPC